MELFWRVELDNGEVYSGVAAGEGELRAVTDLPKGRIKKATGEILLPVSMDTRVFLNGFQSWSHCPERGPDDAIRSLRHLPQLTMRSFGLDRYGDYYFVEYPERRGISHGISYGTWRRGEEFLLIGSLDETPGYTLLQYDYHTGRLALRRDCEGLSAGGPFHVFDLFIARGGEAEVFDAWFAAMGIRPRTREKLAGYSSWYNRYQKIDARCIRSDLKACAGLLEPNDLFQIDDGWETAVGDWLEPDQRKFPAGLRPLADAIHERGFRAGLWLAPFVCQRGSKLKKEHPDWLLKVNGKPWYCGVNWGGFYSLDIDHPEVREYLKQVFRRVLDEWGFDLVKLDFLYGAAPVCTESETRAGRMIRAMDFLRELCGDKLILGCGVPLIPAFGRVDYCRIGCDVGLDWDGSRLMQQTHRERVSTRQSLEDTVYRRQLNGRAFGNDPDVFFLRTENIKLTEEQKEKLAEINALLGDVWLTSDAVDNYTPTQREKYRELRALRDAEDVRVIPGEPVRIAYTLNGERKTVEAFLK